MSEWWQSLSDLNNRYFDGPAPGTTWPAHLEQLNARYHLSGRDELSILPKAELPPTWFIGDVTKVVPGEWALVFSLNPKRDKDKEWYFTQPWEWNADSFWHFQTTWFAEGYWNAMFHGPLTRIVARVLGDAPATSKHEQISFANKHLVFVELCPYASDSFALSPETLVQMRDQDVACQVEAQMTAIMLRDGRPGLILVNGNDATNNFDAVYGGSLQWEWLTYASASKPGKMLWDKPGHLTVGDRTIAIAGFPFLRKPATHNSGIEIDQLAERISGLLH
jgi:hypothetical protein